MSESAGDWLKFSTHFPITACRLKRAELKVLYRLINERQREYGEKVIANLIRQPNETKEIFDARRLVVSQAFITSVTVTAKNGETLTANNEGIFNEVSFPRELRKIFYSTMTNPQRVLNVTPDDRITLLLDFSHPPAVDFSQLPTTATPNDSNFEVAASNEAWFVLSKDRIAEFFLERRSSTDWVHAAGIYDASLFFLGFPLAVWGCVKIERVFPSVDNLSMIPRTLVYSYVFLATLFAFRIMFSYSRWLFPKVEMESDARRSPLRHRAAWTAAVAALFWPAVYDLVKALISYAR